MHKELDDLLCSRYPSLFRDRNADMRTTAMCWGFECGDGWFAVIDVLCGEMQRYAESRGFGSDLQAVQVKEKFGGLRVYLRGTDPYLSGLTCAAESASLWICEECGAPGFVSKQGWRMTRCLEHRGIERPVRFRSALPAAYSEEAVQEKDSDDSWLPKPRNPGWQHLVCALDETLAVEVDGNTPAITIEDMIETETLSFRWRSGDDRGRTAAVFRYFEALSERIDPTTGMPRSQT